jgi:5-methylcytosine-specific restriction endonuclease McrA
MKSYSLLHLDDHVLLRDLARLVSQDRTTTAALLAHLAEVDERKLYRSAAYPSMYLYCVRQLRMSEDVAFARIRVARTARQYPAIFAALADGRLHLSAVVQLTPYLTPDTAEELLALASHKTKTEIELLLAERFPQPDLPTLVQAIAPAVATDELSVLMVGAPGVQLVPEPVGALALQHVPERVVRAKLAPLSPGRFALQVTVDQETYEQLRYAQSLLGHALPSGDVATVLKRALDSLVCELEQRKFARSARSRPRRSHANGRYVPAEIRRKVWQRDGGQCTFVSERGKRCEERTRLEFDHVDPVARGGQTSVDRMRLRCRAHNQYDAERTFGAGFMRKKREEARCSAGRAQAQGKKPTRSHSQPQSQTSAPAASDVVPWLRQLGFKAEEARRVAALCADMPDAPLEERVRIAVRGLAPNCVRRPAPVVSSRCEERLDAKAIPVVSGAIDSPRLAAAGSRC